MRELIKTQNFINFVEQGYADTRRKDNIGFFKHCLRVLLKHNFHVLKQEETNLVRVILRNFKNVFSYPINA